jgi:hypothetical protein
MKSEAALFNACMRQLARLDATDFRNEATFRAQSVRTLVPRGQPQSTRRKPCTGICP